MNIVPYSTFTALALVNENAFQASGALAITDAQNTFIDNMLGFSEYNRRSELLSNMLAHPDQYLQSHQSAITDLITRTKRIFRDQYLTYYLESKAQLEAGIGVNVYGTVVTQVIKDAAKKILIPEYKAKKLATDDALAYFQAGMAYINELFPTEFGELAFEVGGAKSATSKGADIAAMRRLSVICKADRFNRFSPVYL